MKNVGNYIMIIIGLGLLSLNSRKDFSYWDLILAILLIIWGLNLIIDARIEKMKEEILEETERHKE